MHGTTVKKIILNMYFYFSGVWRYCRFMSWFLLAKRSRTVLLSDSRTVPTLQTGLPGESAWTRIQHIQQQDLLCYRTT